MFNISSQNTVSLRKKKAGFHGNICLRRKVQIHGISTKQLISQGLVGMSKPFELLASINQRNSFIIIIHK